MKKLIPSLILVLAAAAELRGATLCFEKHVETTDGPRTWAYELGVAMITPNGIEDFVGYGDSISREDGPGGGEIYSFTASRRLGQLVWNVGGHTFTPQVEMPLTLELVNENSGGPFVAFAGSITVRWVDFPWNDYVKTTFAMGLGLNYSGQIYEIDQIRHRGDDRSNLKFNWPIQATFALPDHPDDQLMIFIIHHSGGRIFDRGGLNALGIGYRRDF
jgi:hypothetical protein